MGITGIGNARFKKISPFKTVITEIVSKQNFQMGLRIVCLGTLLMFGVVSCTIEPLFYLKHPNWFGSGGIDEDAMILRFWRIYSFWDPAFENPPTWLKVMCAIECLIWAPLYWFAFFALFYKQDKRHITFPFYGGYTTEVVLLEFSDLLLGLLYSTVLYFVMEMLENVPGTNWTMVLLVNAPWAVAPIYLVYHEMQTAKREKME